jgi:hypothetical protein
LQDDIGDIDFLDSNSYLIANQMKGYLFKYKRNQDVQVIYNINNSPLNYIKAYPNPIQRGKNIIINGNLIIPAKITISIYNITGDLIKSLDFLSKDCNFNFLLYIDEGFTQEVYFFKIMVNNKIYQINKILITN